MNLGPLPENNFFISQPSSLDAIAVDLIGLQYEATCLFFLASFVTVDENIEEKGLFMGRKCLACGYQLQIIIPFCLFVCLFW